MKTKWTFAKVLLLSLTLLSGVLFAQEKMSEEDRKRNQENRTRVSQEKMREAIELFYGAVAIFGEDEVAAQIINIDSLTATLDQSVGVVNNHIGKVQEVGGEFATVDESVDNKIDSKNARLDKAVADAKKSLADAQAEKKKYSHCSGNERSYMYRDCHKKYTSAVTAERVAEAALRKAQKARKAYGTRQQYDDAKAKAPAMSEAKATDKAAEGPRITSLANGEKLYSAKEKLNAYINDKSKSAIQVAKQAKQIALGLLGIEVNNDFEASKNVTENISTTGKVDKATEMDLLKRVANENAAHKYINLFALSGGASQYFMCENVSDTECVSYHLMVAANAIYLAAQIRETSDYNANSKDIFDTDEDPEDRYDDQYKSLLRAQKIREEALRTTQVRLQSQQILQAMLQKVNDIAMLERLYKEKRVAAAKAQVQKAEQNKKKIENSIKMAFAMYLLEKAFSIKAKIIAAINWAIPYCGGCATAAAFEAESAMWKALEVASYALYTWYGIEYIKARKELKRAKAELKAAEKHTHMRCWKDKETAAAYYSPSFIDNALYLARMFTNTIIPYAHAGVDSSALGTLDEAGIFKYYDARKEDETDTMVSKYPTPETRSEYMQNMVLTMMQDSLAGTDDILSTLEYQSQEYAKIVNNMDTSAKVNEHGQVSGVLGKVEEGSVEKINLKGNGINPGESNFGNLSDYKAKQQLGSKDRTESLKSGMTGSAAIASLVGGNRNATALLKKVADQGTKAKSLLDKAKIKLKSESSDDNIWEEHNKAFMKKFAASNPKYKKFTSDAISDIAKSALDNKKSALAAGKGAKGSGDDEKQVDLTTIAAKGGAGSGSGGSGKGFDPTAGMNFDFDEANGNSDLQGAAGQNDGTDLDRLKGEEALGYLKDQMHRYNTNNSSKEEGIYDGKETLFSIISKRYIKSALPIFFEKKKKE